MVRKDDMGFGTLLNYPNRIQLVSTGNSEMLLFYRMLPASAGECAIAFIELSPSQTVKRYLQTIKNSPMTIEGVSLQLSAFYPKGYRWSLPPDQAKHNETLQLAQIAHVTGKPQFRFLPQNNGFALSIPASELSGNCLNAFCSAAPLNIALAAMRQRMLFGCVSP
jgi:hypothetical protein